MYSVLKNTKITAIAAVVPPTEKSLLEDPDLYFGDQKKIDRIVRSSGFLYRRIADNDVTTADLCEQAANSLFAETKIERSDIDAILFISYTPDYLMPATAYILHNKLGLSSSCLAMDIPQACSGYLFGLYQAGLLINNGCKKVLLLVGDCFSKFSDMFSNHSAPVFGDAGSATLLEYDDKAEDMYFNFSTYSDDYDALICEKGGFRNPPQRENFYENGGYKYCSKMDGGRIFEFTIQKVAPAIKELFSLSKKNKSDIDYFVFHQANRFIIENIANQLDVDLDKVPVSTLTKYGNQCGASIPCAIIDNLSSVVSKQKLHLLLSGFGVGLSIANALVSTDGIYCSEIKNFSK